MTTIIATKDKLVGDTFVSYEVSFEGAPKLWLAKGSAWGGAGSCGMLAQFRLWTLGKAKRPEFKKDDDEKETSEIEVLQLNPQKGIYLWINSDPPEFVNEPFYAIGTGAGFAVGAMSKGASPEEALEIAAKWDKGTRLPGHVITATDLTRKRRGK